MVVMVQVRFFVECFAAGHLHRLDFMRFKQRIHSAVHGCLANFGLALLRQLDKIGNRERTVRLHDDVMDDRALPRLPLTDLYHFACG